jgi:hypothetical protein
VKMTFVPPLLRKREHITRTIPISRILGSVILSAVEGPLSLHNA